MSKVKVIYGSTTGNTENAAETIAAAFDADLVNVSALTSEDLDADFIILGSSTWGLGELQDDWEEAIALLDEVDFSEKTVALFGYGDGCGFEDTFVDAIGTLYDKVTEQGVRVIGFVDSDEYEFCGSTAIRDGKFIGLPLDEENQSELSDDRISRWIDQLKAEL